MSKSLAKQWQEIFDEYREKTGGKGEASDVVKWAITTNRCDISQEKKLQILIKEATSSWRSELTTDKQGRTVRRKHAAPSLQTDNDGKTRQVYFWDNLETADYTHMVASLSYRHSQIRDDVEALRSDVDSYNSNHLPRGKKPIQLFFNFDDGADSVAS